MLVWYLDSVVPVPLARPMLAACRLISVSSDWNSWSSVLRSPEKVPEADCVANVWSWEPGWSVLWYENGERRGAMARQQGFFAG